MNDAPHHRRASSMRPRVAGMHTVQPLGEAIPPRPAQQRKHLVEVRLVLGPGRLRLEQQHQLRYQVGDPVRRPLDDHVVRQPQTLVPPARPTSCPRAARERRRTGTGRSPDHGARSDTWPPVPRLPPPPRPVPNPPRPRCTRGNGPESREMPPRAPRSPDHRAAATAPRGTDPAPTPRRCTRAHPPRPTAPPPAPAPRHPPTGHAVRPHRARCRRAAGVRSSAQPTRTAG